MSKQASCRSSIQFVVVWYRAIGTASLPAPNENAHALRHNKLNWASTRSAQLPQKQIKKSKCLAALQKYPQAFELYDLICNLQMTSTLVTTIVIRSIVSSTAEGTRLERPYSAVGMILGQCYPQVNEWWPGRECARRFALIGSQR